MSTFVPLGLQDLERRLQEAAIAEDKRKRAALKQQQEQAAASEAASRSNVESMFSQLMQGPLKDLGKSRTVDETQVPPPAVVSGQDGVGGPQEDDLLAKIKAEKARRQEAAGGQPPQAQAGGLTLQAIQAEKAKRGLPAVRGGTYKVGPMNGGAQPPLDSRFDAFRTDPKIAEIFADPKQQEWKPPPGQASFRTVPPKESKEPYVYRPFYADEWDNWEKAKLGDMILRQQWEPEGDKPSGAQAFMANAYNSALLGQGDKVRATVGGLGSLISGEGFDKGYQQTEQDSRDWLAKTHEYEPGWSFAGEAAGFIAPGGLAAKGVSTITKGGVNAAMHAAPAMGALAPIVRLGARAGDAALQGAAAGGLFGHTVGAEDQAINQGLESPSIFAPERFESAGHGAQTGALFGGAMPVAGVLTRPARNFIGGVAARALEPFKPGAIAAHNQAIGTQAALRSLERAGILNVEDFLKRAAKYGDKPVVTGELGQDTLNSLVALVRAKGTTGDKAAAILEDRVQGLPGRMLKDIADETGMDPATVMGTIEDMVKSSRAAAAPYYDKSEQTPFAETPNLERIAKSPAVQHVLDKARGRLENQNVVDVASRYGGDLGSDMTSVGAMSGRVANHPLKHWDEVKQLLDEEINYRLANQIGIDDVQGVRDALVRELDTISAEGADYAAALSGNPAQLTAPRASPYAQAREAGGDAPRIQAGLKAGEKALSGTQSVEAIAREVAQLSGGQLTAYQYGVIRNMAKQVENGTLTPKRIKSMAWQNKLNEVFGKPAAEGLTRKFAIEADLATKGTRWNPNVGAVTSQAQLGMPSQAADAAVNLGAAALRGDKFSASMQLFNMLRRRGYSETQRNALGDILLMSPDEAAGVLYPGKTPGPGTVPPPIPPAGQVRTNPPGGAPPPTGGAGASVPLGPLVRDAASGALGAGIGAATTPDGEDPVARALMYGGAFAGGSRLATLSARNPALAGVESAGFMGKQAQPWQKAMRAAGMDDAEVDFAHRYMLSRFQGRTPEQIADEIGVAPGAVTSRVQELQSRLDDAGIGVELDTARIAPELVGKRAPHSPAVTADKLPPKDIVTQYNDRDALLDIALDLDVPETSNMASVIQSRIQKLRGEAVAAKQSGAVDRLAKDWNVTPDEIEKFAAGRPNYNSGNYQQNVERIVSLMEKAEKAGNPIRPMDAADRLGLKRGSVAAMLSMARNGVKPLPPELVARLKALNIPKGRPIEFAGMGSGKQGVWDNLKEDAGLATVSSAIGSFNPDDPEHADPGRGLGLAALILGAKYGMRGAGGAARGAAQAGFAPVRSAGGGSSALPNLIEDATDESLLKTQLDMISRGEVPPVFKTFRLPNGRVIAWNGDESMGGVPHDQARQILGLGNMRLEHGQSYFGGPSLAKTNWYSVSGEGEAPRSVEKIVRQGVLKGETPTSAIQDAYPHEIERDLRSIGAMGPAKSMADYPFRRALALSQDNIKDAHSVSWKTTSGLDARVSFGKMGPQADPNVEVVDFRINGKTGNDGGPTIPTGEAADAFQKAMAVLEREVISRQKDMYVFRGAGPKQNRLYANTLQQRGAPQGYVAIVDRDSGNFAFLSQARFKSDIEAGRIDPNSITVIPSKAGNKAVPDWRVATGQFAVPAIAGGYGLAEAIRSQGTDEPRPQ